MRTYNFEELH